LRSARNWASICGWATLSNVFNSRAITAISNAKNLTPAASGSIISYQTSYGKGDQFSFLPPRSFMVDLRVKY
jgi:iron complex outermembrane receptor protein